MKRLSVIIFTGLMLAMLGSTASAEMITVFSDDYDTVWGATPVPANMGILINAASQFP